MKNPFTRLFRARDKPGATDSVSSAPTFYFGSSAAGKSVTASTAIQMSTVYACVRVIAETIASLPLHVYQNQGEGSVKALDHPLYPDSARRTQQRDDLVRLARNDDLRICCSGATPIARSFAAAEVRSSVCIRCCRIAWRWTGTARAR